MPLVETLFGSDKMLRKAKGSTSKGRGHFGLSLVSSTSYIVSTNEVFLVSGRQQVGVLDSTGWLPEKYFPLSTLLFLECYHLVIEFGEPIFRPRYVVYVCRING